MTAWTFDRETGWQRVFVVLFFAAFLGHLLSPITLIADFWWHLTSGRWIAVNGVLPTHDPFLSTAVEQTDLRQTIILKGYWLAQLFFYGIQNWLGSLGAVFFKAAILTSVFFCQYLCFRRSGFERLPACALVAPLTIFASEYNELRPHLFSFLGMILLYYLLEAGFEEGAAGRRLRDGRLKYVPLLMLLWANLHPGFILGGLTIALYVACAIASRLSGRRQVVGSPGIELVMMAGLIASLCNPNGFSPYLLPLQEHNLGSVRFAEVVTEFYPFWRYYGTVGKPYMVYLCAGWLVFLTVLLLILAFRKKLCARHLLLYTALLGLALLGFRYVIFLVLVGPAIIAVGFGRQLPAGARSRKLSLAVAAGFVLWFGSNLAGNPVFAGQAIQVRGADQVADHLLANQHAPVLFNDYEMGGYLAWRLFPAYRPFIDARALDYGVFKEHWKVKNGRKFEVFLKYRVGTVACFIDDPAKQTIQPLIFSLLEDRSWNLTFYNGSFAVFAKVSADDRKFKNQFIDALLANIRPRAAAAPNETGHLVVIGQLLRAKGDHEGALQAFLQAKAVAPRDPVVDQWLNIMKQRIEVYN